MDDLRLHKVQYLPKKLESGVLYVSEEFNVAGHLCACGCGNKVITPLSPTEWLFTEKEDKASLYPSIGNWQLPCKSHYWITHGQIEWSYQWTEEEIETGRMVEERRRKQYYAELNLKHRRKSIFRRILDWIFR